MQDNMPTSQSYEEIMTGLKYRKNKKNGFAVIRIHYTADEDKRSKEWKENEMIGVSESDWEREMEINYERLDGKRVVPEYNPDIHRKNLIFNPHLPIHRGWDFGYRHPACIWIQVNEKNQICILKALLGNFIKLEDFISEVKLAVPQVMPDENGNFIKVKFKDYCDPAGVQTNDQTAKSAISIMRSKGVYPLYKKSSPALRAAIMRTIFSIREDGEPGALINQSCQIVHDGLIGGYCMPEEATSKSITERDNPIKEGYYEHIFDPFGYVLIFLVKYRAADSSGMVKKTPVFRTKIYDKTTGAIIGYK